MNRQSMPALPSPRLKLNRQGLTCPVAGRILVISQTAPARVGWSRRRSNPKPKLAYIGPGGSLEAFVKAKERGKVRHIGFTGHHDAEVHLALLYGYEGWETVQRPFNLIDPYYLSFVENVLPKVDAKGLGKIAMKSNAIGAILDNKIAGIEECQRFVMSRGPDTIVSGVETVEQLEQNVGIVKNLKPYNDEEVSQLLSRTGKGPFGPDLEQYKRRTLSAAAC